MIYIIINKNKSAYLFFLKFLKIIVYFELHLTAECVFNIQIQKLNRDNFLPRQKFTHETLSLMERIHVTVRARPLSLEDAKTSPWRITGNSISIPNHSSKFEFGTLSSLSSFPYSFLFSLFFSQT